MPLLCAFVKEKAKYQRIIVTIPDISIASTLTASSGGKRSVAQAIPNVTCDVVTKISMSTFRCSREIIRNGRILFTVSRPDLVVNRACWFESLPNKIEADNGTLRPSNGQKDSCRWRDVQPVSQFVPHEVSQASTIAEIASKSPRLLNPSGLARKITLRGVGPDIKNDP